MCLIPKRLNMTILTTDVVARAGHGDMAVSNAFGSNIFDIFLGLGFPFVLSNWIYSEPVSVQSDVRERLLNVELAQVANALSPLIGFTFLRESAIGYPHLCRGALDL